MRTGGRGAGGLLLVALIAVAILLADRVERDGGGEGSGPVALAAGEEVRAEVERVVDGDTIEVSLDGRTEDVRYIGVDTPESVAPDQPVECLGPEAAELNRRLVGGETVRLRFDRELRDRYGRLLAYVYAGGHLVNAELVERGFATTLEIEPNTSRAGMLERLELDASTSGRGLWGRC